MKLPDLTPFLTKIDFVLNYVPERLNFKKGSNILYLHYWTHFHYWTLLSRACHCLGLRSALAIKYDHERPVAAPLIPWTPGRRAVGVSGAAGECGHHRRAECSGVSGKAEALRLKKVIRGSQTGSI